MIPVLDLMHGCVVRGVAGRRAEYRPVESVLCSSPQPAAVARAFQAVFEFQTAYVADLDAIAGQPVDEASLREIASAGLAVWLDAGIASCAEACDLHRRLMKWNVDATLVLGLETIPSPSVLRAIVGELGTNRLAFSLDLMDGQPLTAAAEWRGRPPLEIVAEAVAAGMGRVIVLDLAGVGIGQGPRATELCELLRDEYSALELIGGGGMRGLGDLCDLRKAGCSGALVASALHQGALTKDDLAKLAGLDDV